MLGIPHNFYWNAKPVPTLAIGSVFSTLQVVPLMMLTLDAWRLRRMPEEARVAAGPPTVLATKLKMVKSLRYEIEYRNITVKGDTAEVEVFLDGSFELAADFGDRYRRVNDYHHFVLEHENDQWKFVRGM